MINMNERITCLSGHTIGRFRRSVSADTVMDNEHVAWEKGQEPVWGQPIDECICKQCGEPWAKAEPFLILNIEGEWRKK